MINVLIHSNRKELDRDLSPVDYEKLYLRKIRNGGGNVGNKLFLTAVDSYLRDENIYFEYLTDDMTIEYINDRFDLIIWPLANCFSASKAVLGYIAAYTERIRQYHIPVLALGAGVQAGSYDAPNELADAIKSEATMFISSVHNTGGVFGLRGYFTKEFFEQLGFYDDIVIGCPSMYQMGRNLQIHKSKIEEIRPVFNGNADSLRQFEKSSLFEKFPSSVFIDQGDYIELLYNPAYQKKVTFFDLAKMVKDYTGTEIKVLSQNRIVCLYDLPILSQFLLDKGVNFSFGQRIHGNILCTLLGIPSVVAYCDSRTKELAEFFDIPTYKVEKDDIIDISYIYENASWDRFNRSFSEKYDRFNHLLKAYGIPSIESRDVSAFRNPDGYHMPKRINDFSPLKKWTEKEWVRKMMEIYRSNYIR